MARRSTSLLVAGALALAPFSTVHAARAGRSCSNGLDIPINVTSTDQGTFNGVLHITKFANIGGMPTALGTVTGTLVDENGAATGIVRNVGLPLVLPTGTTSSGIAGGEVGIGTQAICEVLHLELGPLHLNLLGLIVDLNQVVLDITADSAGGLLGSLLCSVAGLLGGGQPLQQIVNQLVTLLNTILGALG
jgi:hypothetical protein